MGAPGKGEGKEEEGRKGKRGKRDGKWKRETGRKRKEGEFWREINEGTGRKGCWVGGCKVKWKTGGLK